MTAIDFDGYPHTVPVSYILDGKDITVARIRQTREVDYIRANPRGCITIGGRQEDGAGTLLKGNFSIEEDQARRWLWRTTERCSTGDGAEDRRAFDAFAQKDMIILRLRDQKVIKVV